MKGDIVADVRLYPTGDGGRAGPTPSDRWACLLAVADVVLDCRLLLAGVERLAPGDKATVPIVFLSPDFARNYLAVGTQFTLREVQVVGEGEVVSTDFPTT